MFNFVVRTTVSIFEYVINHYNSTGVTSGVTLVKKIELKIEHSMDKMDHGTQN